MKEYTNLNQTTIDLGKKVPAKTNECQKGTERDMLKSKVVKMETESNECDELMEVEQSSSVTNGQPCEIQAVLFNIEEPLKQSTFEAGIQEEIPDEFFELTDKDIRRNSQRKFKEIHLVKCFNFEYCKQEMEEQPLMTSAMRKAKTEGEYSRCDRVVIHVHFHGKLVLQGLFRPRETVFAVQKFVKEYLKDKSIPFYLYTSPPKNLLKDDSQTLIEARLIPATVVYFGSEQHRDHYLFSAVLPELSSKLKADMVVAECLNAVGDKDVSHQASGSMKKQPSGTESQQTSSTRATASLASGSCSSVPATVSDQSDKPKWVKLGERHTIKIIEEPSSYGIMNSYQGGHVYRSQSSMLKMRISPSNFSGPALFKRLLGKCFNKTLDNYKYEYCPFYNVTQHEQSLRWNPYSGILGVWQEWEIKNNTFVAMIMREGDKCGDHQRTIKVFFICDKENKILNVTEPSMCNYHMNFSTPYVCHHQAMLVYPTLSQELQTEWGLLEGELQKAEITEKGYTKYLRRIFVKAGYMLNEEIKLNMATEAVKNEKKAKENTDSTFENLYQCTEQYRRLKKQVEDLTALLDAQKDGADQNVINMQDMEDNDEYVMDSMHIMDN